MTMTMRSKTLRYYEGTTLIVEHNVTILKQEEWKPGYTRIWYRRPTATMRPEDTIILEGRNDQFVITTDCMREEYDFSVAIKNPYGKELK